MQGAKPKICPPTPLYLAGHSFLAVSGCSELWHHALNTRHLKSQGSRQCHWGILHTFRPQLDSYDVLEIVHSLNLLLAFVDFQINYMGGKTNQALSSFNNIIAYIITEYLN